jgi:hypothetical protein
VCYVAFVPLLLALTKPAEVHAENNAAMNGRGDR